MRGVTVTFSKLTVPPPMWSKVPRPGPSAPISTVTPSARVRGTSSRSPGSILLSRMLAPQAASGRGPALMCQVREVSVRSCFSSPMPRCIPAASASS